MAPSSRRFSSQSSPAPPSPTTSADPHTQYASLADLVGSTASPPGSPASPRSRTHFFSPRASYGAATNGHGSPTTTPTRRWGSSGFENEERLTRDRTTPADSDESSSDASIEEGDLLSTADMIKLTLGLLGAQLTWTVEMAFGTPYLLSLGLTKQGTSLVWLAGPLSGLIVQPIVGAISDSSTSPYRRRQFILLSTVLIILSTLFVAYARQIASVISSVAGLGDWDPKEEEWEAAVARWVGVSGFWVLDFGLNGLQGSLRALILDRSPPSQAATSNAWHGRQTHLGNIFGYLFGFLNLGHAPVLGWVGGGQFRKLAIISCLIMVVTVGVTCWTQTEEIVPSRVGDEERAGLKGVFSNVRESIRDLPLAVRRVCYVQFFAWTAWFPFLFYSTTYVSEVLYTSLPPSAPPPSTDAATRAGALALLLYALVALAVGAILPLLSTLGRRGWVDRILSRRTTKGRLARTVLASCSPRNSWTIGLALYALVMGCSFFVRGVAGAMVVVAFCGVPWAITCWVPFALVMESIRTIQQSAAPRTSPTRSASQSAALPSSLDSRRLSPTRFKQPFRATTISSTVPGTPTRASAGRQAALGALNECSPLLSGAKPSSEQHYQAEEDVGQTSNSGQASAGSSAQAGGTILGIHNLSIVVPQFFVALVAAGIFKILAASRAHSRPSTGLSFIANSTLALLSDSGSGGGGGDEPLRATNDVVWVLRFGGLAAALGAVVSRWLVMPQSEREYREWLLAGEDEAEEAETESEDLADEIVA